MIEGYLSLMSAPLRYLSAAQIDACLPAMDERLELAGRALSALGRGSAEMPPKIGVHPRPGALLHAMPAWLRDGDLVGMKWIAAFPANRSHGLPAINGLIVLNDAQTGLPTWIMDAARITAVRTATVSGVAIRLFAPPTVRRVALLGGGVQAHSHAELLRDLLPEAELVVFDPHADRAKLVVDAHVAAGGRASAAASAPRGSRRGRGRHHGRRHGRRPAADGNRLDRARDIGRGGRLRHVRARQAGPRRSPLRRR